MKKVIFSGVSVFIVAAILKGISFLPIPFKEIVLSVISIVLLFLLGLLFKKLSPKTEMRDFFAFKKLRFKDYGTVLGCLFILAFGSFMLNVLVDFFCELASVEIGRTEIVLTDTNYAVMLITVALLPAFYEEIFFRGALQSYLKDKGDVLSVCLCAALFTVMHGLDPYFLSTFFAGIVLSVVVKMTGSIYAAIFIHFVNNILSYVLAYYSDRLSHVQLNSIMIYFAGLVFIVSVYFVLSMMIRKRKKELKRHRIYQVEE